MIFTNFHVVLNQETKVDGDHWKNYGGGRKETHR